MTYVPIPLPNRVNIQKNEAIKVVSDYYIHMCKRHSVRDFSKEPVSNAIIEKIIETAGRAPSGANQQPWHFVAIKDPEKKAKDVGVKSAGVPPHIPSPAAVVAAAEEEAELCAAAAYADEITHIPSAPHTPSPPA